VQWMELAEDRNKCLAFVNTEMKLRLPYNARNLLSGWETTSFQRRTILQIL